jgi:hypothetical protein
MEQVQGGGGGGYCGWTGGPGPARASPGGRQPAYGAGLFAAAQPLGRARRPLPPTPPPPRTCCVLPRHHHTDPLPPASALPPPKTQACDELVQLIKDNGRWVEPPKEEEEEAPAVAAVA